MKTVTIDNENLKVEISVKNIDVTWKEIMVEVINNINGHSYVSDELDNLQESWNGL